MNPTELMQAIADAIREKTKKTDKINAQNFPTEIKNISGGSGTTVTKELNEAGGYTITITDN